MEQLRGSCPDYVSSKEWIIEKNCNNLYLTYQIKLLTFLAMKNNVKLIVSVLDHCVVSELLSDFICKYSNIIMLDRRVNK